MGVDRKIERAKAKLADLKESIKAVVDPGHYRFAVKYDPETKRHVYRVYDVPATDPEWPLVIGEVLFNLRSALDHLAWQLVLLGGGEPTQETQFPIRDSPNDKNGQVLPLKALLAQVKDPKILGLLNECQPYAGDGTEHRSPFDAHGTPLWHLKKLNNLDKHRLLMIVACVLNIDTMWWGTRTGERSPKCFLNTVPVKDGTPVAWFDFRGAEPPADFDPHPSLKIVVREPDDAPALSHIEVGGAIENLCWWVEWQVLNMRFAPLFFPNGRPHGSPKRVRTPYRLTPARAGWEKISREVRYPPSRAGGWRVRRGWSARARRRGRTSYASTGHWLQI